MAAKTQTRTCILCDRRPVDSNAPKSWCTVCWAVVKKNGNGNGNGSNGNGHKPNYILYVRYRGWLVGLFRKADDSLSATSLYHEPYEEQLDGSKRWRIPQDKFVDLDSYVEGADRKQIKRWKKLVLQMMPKIELVKGGRG